MNSSLYIVNPISGKGRGSKVIPLIKKCCKEADVTPNIVLSEYKTHAIKLAKENSFKYKNIIAVGGDGTVNEVINGILEGNSSTKLCVLPVGSGNDFTKNINLPDNIKDILSVIVNPNKQNIIYSDIGEIVFKEYGDNSEKKHYFINGLGIGFDAYVAYLNQSNKTLSGILSYVLAVFKALVNYKMIDVIINSDRFYIKGEKLMISIGNGISSGGGFYLTPQAIINDRILNLSSFNSITRKRLLTALPMALLNKINKVPEAIMYKFNELSVELSEPYYVHCDGEVLSKKLISANIRVSEKVLNIITSKG